MQKRSKLIFQKNNAKKKEGCIYYNTKNVFLYSKTFPRDEMSLCQSFARVVRSYKIDSDSSISTNTISKKNKKFHNTLLFCMHIKTWLICEETRFIILVKTVFQKHLYCNIISSVSNRLLLIVVHGSYIRLSMKN